MNIPDMADQDKPGALWRGAGDAIRGISQDWVLMAILLLTASLFFGLGLLAAKEYQKPKDQLWIEQLPAEERAGEVATSSAVTQTPIGGGPAAAVSAVQPTTGVYVASKSGTKYYLPSCSGAKRIKEENKVWFQTKEEAEKAGYGPASGCKGL
jgi:hypothetical protein